MYNFTFSNVECLWVFFSIKFNYGYFYSIQIPCDAKIVLMALFQNIFMVCKCKIQCISHILFLSKPITYNINEYLSFVKYFLLISLDLIFWRRTRHNGNQQKPLDNSTPLCFPRRNQSLSSHGFPCRGRFTLPSIKARAPTLLEMLYNYV